FQAEDGIRDGHVTGVQTCALPISPSHFVPRITAGSIFIRKRRPTSAAPGWESRSTKSCASSRSGTCGGSHENHRRRRRAWSDPRSEERRVGKEGRCRRAQSVENDK